MKSTGKQIVYGIGMAALAGFLTGCGREDHAHSPETFHGHDHGHTHAHPHSLVASPVRVAIAEMEPTEGYSVRGTVTFFQETDGIRVVADFSGFGEGPRLRGFHVHEHGDCSAPDAMSAGGHFNPHGARHGGPDDVERHAGDFGNIEVADDGTARMEFVDSMISFEGEASIIGRSVIIHAQEDDLTSQPTGDAGGRVACGVIRVLSSVEIP